ncbi:MAG: ATP-binding protein [Clostridiaceae bacterium]
MKLRRRLIISNAIVVILPILITLFIALIFIFVASNFSNKEISYSNLKRVADMKSELVNIRNSISNQNSEAALEKEFQQHLVSKLSELKGDLIITKDDNIIFSSKEVSKIDVEKSLEASKDKIPNNFVKLNNITYIVDIIPLNLPNESIGNVILLGPVGEETNIFIIFILVIATVFIGSFIAINFYIAHVFSKTMLKPISFLKTAASEISSGNLNYKIVEDGDDEIKELCHTFDFMRIQLKDSVHMKMKYDENRTTLVSSISHDLKTPITSIKGYVEGILDGVANTPEKLESYLKTIYSKAEHIDGMIDDLLLYSKLDLNQLPFNFEKTDVIEYFQDCISENESELRKANIELSLNIQLVNSKYVIIDRERLKRVINNIIDNSRKYMEKLEGKITVILRETNTSIIIEVRDNGAGIDKDDIDKIFDRFYRADASRGITKGSGLGLAIGKQIVEGHKGKIWAVGHENEGTSIMISLAKASSKNK